MGSKIADANLTELLVAINDVTMCNFCFKFSILEWQIHDHKYASLNIVFKSRFAFSKKVPTLKPIVDAAGLWTARKHRQWRIPRPSLFFLIGFPQAQVLEACSSPISDSHSWNSSSSSLSLSYKSSSLKSWSSSIALPLCRIRRWSFCETIAYS